MNISSNHSRESTIPPKIYITYLEELIVFKDFSAVIIHWTFGFGQPLGAAQEIPKGSPSSTSIVCGGSSLKLNSSDLRTKTELVMAVPYLFLAKHWYWPKKWNRKYRNEYRGYYYRNVRSKKQERDREKQRNWRKTYISSLHSLVSSTHSSSKYRSTHSSEIWDVRSN